MMRLNEALGFVDDTVDEHLGLAHASGQRCRS